MTRPPCEFHTGRGASDRCVDCLKLYVRALEGDSEVMATMPGWPKSDLLKSVREALKQEDGEETMHFAILREAARGMVAKEDALNDSIHNVTVFFNDNPLARTWLQDTRGMNEDLKVLLRAMLYQAERCK